MLRKFARKIHVVEFHYCQNIFLQFTVTLFHNNLHEKNNEQRAKSNEQRAKSNEQRANSNEQQAKSNKQQPKSNKKRAKTNEQRPKSQAFFIRTPMERCF